MKNEKYFALLKETFGEDYAKLMLKERQDAEVSERNARIILIEDIMKARKLIGLPPSVKMFDHLYDMPFDQLQLASVIWHDEVYYHNSKTKKP